MMGDKKKLPFEQVYSSDNIPKFCTNSNCPAEHQTESCSMFALAGLSIRENFTMYL